MTDTHTEHDALTYLREQIENQLGISSVYIDMITLNACEISCCVHLYGEQHRFAANLVDDPEDSVWLTDVGERVADLAPQVMRSVINHNAEQMTEINSLNQALARQQEYLDGVHHQLHQLAPLARQAAQALRIEAAILQDSGRAPEGCAERDDSELIEIAERYTALAEAIHQTTATVSA